MGVDYYYPVVFSSDEGAESVQVAVCDSTGSDEYIKVVLAHKIIDFEDENAIVTEMFVLVNGGDRTYVGDEESVTGDERGILIFTLPQGATGFQSAPELAADFLLLNDSRVAYTVPFPPGELQLFFSYSLPMPRGDELAISFTADYPTDYLDVMVKSNNIEVATGQLAPADPVETGTGDRYIHYTGQSISRDSSIEIRLVRLSDSSSFIFILSILFPAIIIVAVVVFLVKRKRSVGEQRVNNDAGEDA
jgi:hypothetical protein